MAEPRSPIETWMRRVRAHLVAHGYRPDTMHCYRAGTRKFLIFLKRRHVDIISAQQSHLDSYLAAERRRFRERHGRDPDPAGGWRTRRVAPIPCFFVWHKSAGRRPHGPRRSRSSSDASSAMAFTVG